MGDQYQANTPPQDIAIFQQHHKRDGWRLVSTDRIDRSHRQIPPPDPTAIHHSSCAFISHFRICNTEIARRAFLAVSSDGTLRTSVRFNLGGIRKCAKPRLFS